MPTPKQTVEGPIKRQWREAVESYAWDATVGAGNDSEVVDFRALKRRLGCDPTEDEMHWFKQGWERGLQAMAQP